MSDSLSGQPYIIRGWFEEPEKTPPRNDFIGCFVRAEKFTVFNMNGGTMWDNGGPSRIDYGEIDETKGTMFFLKRYLERSRSQFEYHFALNPSTGLYEGTHKLHSSRDSVGRAICLLKSVEAAELEILESMAVAAQA